MNQALHPRIITSICPGRKKCKFIRRLKINKDCMKCQVESSQMKLAGIISGGTHDMKKGKERDWLHVYVDKSSRSRKQMLHN